MDNQETNQFQVLANDLYIIQEKIVKTDAIIKVVKEKSKRCNKLEKIHKKLLDTHIQLQLKQSETESKLKFCLLNHTPLELELNELKTRLVNTEALHSEYVNAAEFKYQSVCRELENMLKAQLDSPPKTKDKRNKKTIKSLIKEEELSSKYDDLIIELELTKSELESLNRDIIKKDKIINKYEYEKQILNEKIESLNNNLIKKQIIKHVNKTTVGIQTDNFNVNNPIIEHDFVLDDLPQISEFDNTLPILSDSICADIVNSSDKELTSSYMQTDDLFFFRKKEQTFKSFGVQTDFITKSKSCKSFACQTSFETNCVAIQTDDDLWIEHTQNLRREKLKTSGSQTYYDDILNVEDILYEMTMINPLISPLSPTITNECVKEEANETNTIAVGSEEIIPIFVDFCSQTDHIKKVESYTQTEINKDLSDSINNTSKNNVREKVLMIDFNCQTDQIIKDESNLQPEINKDLSDSIITDENKTSKNNVPEKMLMIDFKCQTDQIQLVESNTQTESQRKVDSTSQTDHINETFNLKPLPSNLLSPNIKMSPRFWETKLKNRLYTPNSKIFKKYRTTKNKLLEHLKLSNLDFKQILEKYLSEGNGPTLFVSPKILKSSQMHNNSCKHQNPFINISNRSCCNSKPFNMQECPCFHSCNVQRNYPSCTTLQCNISCNGYCNRSHQIKIKHNTKAVIVSSDSEEEEYKIRNYYKNKFRNKYRAKHNCKCNEFSKENFHNKINSLKKEVKTSDTDASNDVFRRKRRRRHYISSSDSDDSTSQNNCSHRDKHKRPKLKNPISQIAQEKVTNTVSTDKNTNLINNSSNTVSQNNRDKCQRSKHRNPVSKSFEEENNPAQKDPKSVHMERRIDNEETLVVNDNINLIDSNCDNVINTKLNKNKITKISNKNITKPTKEKVTKIKRMRKLLNETPLNYNKSNIQTRSMVKNIQVESNEKQNNSSNLNKKELYLFGSISECSSSDSNVDENLNKSFLESTANIKTRNNLKNEKVLLNTQKQINNVKDVLNKQNNKSESLVLNTTPKKNQIKNCVSPSKVEKLDTQINHVYKRPERKQIIPIGPLSPEPVTCNFIKPKNIPLEQISNTLSSNSSEKNITKNVKLDFNLQSQSKINILSSVINSKPIKEANLLQNVATCSGKQSKIQAQEKKYATKMISDIATMDWNINLINTVVESLVERDVLVIAKLIVNEAAVDHAQQLDKTYTPPAPLMTPSQQKLLVLINRLEDEGLNGLKKNIIILAEKRILSEKYLTNVLGLTRIYVALCKLQYDIEGVRMFCCNAAYYLGDLVLPIMFIVLTMWGDVLPMASEDVPLAITLVQVIQSKTCNTPGYNSSSLNCLLSDYYQYKRGQTTNDEIMVKLVACFVENPCSSIFTSILILCKNVPSNWRFSQLKKHFIPLVDKYMVDQSKTKLISMTLTLVNRIKDMFNLGNDKEYINELNVWLVKFFANNSNNTSNSLST